MSSCPPSATRDATAPSPQQYRTAPAAEPRASLPDAHPSAFKIAPLEYHDDLHDWHNKPRYLLSRRGSLVSSKLRFLTKKAGSRGRLARGQSLLRKLVAKGLSYRHWLLSIRAPRVPPAVLLRLLKRVGVSALVLLLLWGVCNAFSAPDGGQGEGDVAVVPKSLPSDDVILQYDIEALQSPDGRYDLFRKIYGGEQAGRHPYQHLYGRQPLMQPVNPLMQLAVPDHPGGTQDGGALDEANAMPSDDAVLKYEDEAMKTIDGRYSLFRKIYGGGAGGGAGVGKTGWFLNAKLYGEQPAHFGFPGQPVGVPAQPVGVLGQPGGVPGQPGGVLGQLVGVPGQPGGVLAQPGGVLGQPGAVPGQPGGVLGQPAAMPVRYPGQNIGLQGQLPGVPAQPVKVPVQVPQALPQPAAVPGQLNGVQGQPAGAPVQPPGQPAGVQGLLPGQPAGQPMPMPGNQALGAPPPGQPQGQAAGVPGLPAGNAGWAGGQAAPLRPAGENGGLGENPFNKFPEGGAAQPQPAEGGEVEVPPEDIVPSARNVTMPETRLVIFSAVPKCGSATTARLFKTLSLQNRFTAMVPQIRIQPRLAEQQREVLLKNLMTHALKVPVAYVRHIFYMDNVKLGFPQVSWVAIVRDPVERLISQFYYIRIESRYDAVKLLEGRKPPPEFFNMTLDECVPAKDTKCWYRKGTHQMLQLSFFCGQETFCQMVGDRKALQLAKYHAETRYSAVGILEDLGLSYKVFQHYLPMFFAKATTVDGGNGDMRLNSQDEKPAVSERTKNMMRSFLKEDLEFYQFLKQRLYLQAEEIARQQ
ncbi:uncharacterized protein LOC122260735 [Penaeus japonicus]|uniref:uncharacterized protein LOC122260735 n=1 Tax=Penaeus japonicus TaxID=27405 RepID=UPI001C714F2F|nr:uncharacterized protein LOC122260735 [Penaeus japonicus]